ncbi:MAG TPA: DNA glycosylase, partial [Acidobacteriota bacterium]|nr:DNA glycosylase [Acidobacteriota bacterium]
MRSAVHRLPVEGPLDLSLTFTCGQAFRWREEEGVWSGVVAGGEWRVAAEDGLLRVEARGRDPGADAIRRYLRLDESPELHLAHAEELRALPGFTDLLGMRLLRQEPWETLISFICSAASNVRKISNSVEGMAARWGEPIAGSDRRAFPAPAARARVRERERRAHG